MDEPMQSSAESVVQTSDGGYILAGYVEKTGNAFEFWVIKLNSVGIVQWQKMYGTTLWELANSIKQTSDGGYIVAGYTSQGTNTKDIWIMKLNPHGEIEWQNYYVDGNGGDIAEEIEQTSDGGYIVAAYKGPASSNNKNDIWILKLDSAGNIEWQKLYGGLLGDIAMSIAQTSDGGYIVAGFNASFTETWPDAWILKLDSSGEIMWQKEYTGTSGEWFYSIKQTSDGNYIVAGRTESFGAGIKNIWILKLDTQGNIIWQKSYGTEGYQQAAYSIKETSDGGYIIAGNASLIPGNASVESNEIDLIAIVIKLDSEGNIIWQKGYGAAERNGANEIIQTADGGYLVAGVTEHEGEYWDLLVIKMSSTGNVDTTCVYDTDFITMDSDAWVIDTPAVAEPYSGWIISSVVQPVDSNIPQIYVCGSAGALPGAVPDNDNYPGTPLSVSKSGSNLLLTWGAPGGACLTADYAIYRGTLPFQLYNHLPFVCTTGGATSAAIYSPNRSYYFLVVAHINALEGSYGLNSSDTQRPQSSSACFPQQISACN